MICAVGVDFYILPVVGGLGHNHETFSMQLVELYLRPKKG